MFGANSHEGSFVYATVYNSFLEPNNYIDDAKFLRDDLVHQLLQTVEIGNSYPVEYMVEEAYFQVSSEVETMKHWPFLGFECFRINDPSLGLADGRLGADATGDH